MSKPFQLVDSGWDRLIDKSVTADHSELRVICPFIKKGAAGRLLKAGTPNRIQVITRFNLKDFCGGVSDTSALRLLLEHGAQIRGVKGLHSKLYLFGQSRVIVTSANLTEAALSRNYEFGFLASTPEIISGCRDYFNDLWRRAGVDLTADRIDRWDLQLRSVNAGGSRPSLRGSLPDEGVDAGQITAPVPMAPFVESSDQAFVKFFGEGSNRATRSMRVIDEVKSAGCHWACTYPTGKRPRQVKDGDILYMARLVQQPPDIMIFGKAVGIKHEPQRDDATPYDIKLRPWKKQWRHYIRVHHAEFILGRMADGVSLNELMSTLGANSFVTTQANAARGSGNTNPRKALMQQAAVRLSAQGLEWLEQALQRQFELHGKIPDSELDRLDWPVVPGLAGGPLSAKGRNMLRVLVDFIGSGRVNISDPETYPSYKDTLIALDLEVDRGRLGPIFQREGGSDLNDWAKENKLPAITGLVVDRRTNTPGGNYFIGNDCTANDTQWWLREMKKSAAFDWTPYL